MTKKIIIMEVENRASKNAQLGERHDQGEKIQKRGYKRRVITVVIISIVNVALLTLLWSQLFVPAQSSSTGGSSNTESTQSKSPLEGRPAPDFTLAQLTQGSAPPIHLANFKGKPLVINLWAS